MYNNTLLCVDPTSEEFQEHYTQLMVPFKMLVTQFARIILILGDKIYGEMAAQVGK